jgi:hypothetical protein
LDQDNIANCSTTLAFVHKYLKHPLAGSNHVEEERNSTCLVKRLNTL